VISNDFLRGSQNGSFPTKRQSTKFIKKSVSRQFYLKPILPMMSIATPERTFQCTKLIIEMRYQCTSGSELLVNTTEFFLCDKRFFAIDITDHYAHFMHDFNKLTSVLYTHIQLIRYLLGVHHLWLGIF
jgi:hypothetical protein